MSTSTKTQFDLSQAKKFIKYIIKNNRLNAKKGIKKKVAFQLEGGAGLGKTSAVAQVCEEEELDFCKLNLAQIEELGDLIGFPYKKYFIEKDGEEKTVSEKELTAWYRAGWSPSDKQPVMSYAIPEWISNRKESGILLLDDWTRADPRFIQAVMDLIDRSEYVSWSLPPDWHILLTSNPDNGEYLVSAQDDAQKTRYLTADIKYNEKIWADWAEGNHIDSRCINFMLLNPECVTGVHDADGEVQKQAANPRQWVNFFHTVGNIENFTESEEVLERVSVIGNMAVGSDLMHLFMQFLNQKLDKLITPERMLTLASQETVMQEIKECVGTGDTYRGDIGSVLALRFANWTIRYAKDSTVSEAQMDRIHDLIVGEVFGSDLSFIMAKKIFNSNRQKFLKLISREKFTNYISATG